MGVGNRDAPDITLVVFYLKFLANWRQISNTAGVQAMLRNKVRRASGTNPAIELCRGVRETRRFGAAMVTGLSTFEFAVHH